MYCIFQQPPFVFKNDSAPSGYSGYVIDLLDALTELIHFKYTVYESPDGEYGRMQPDKSWTGVIKELIDGVIIFSSLYKFFFSMYHVMLKNENMNEMVETISHQK